MKKQLIVILLFSFLSIHTSFGANGEPCDGEMVILENTLGESNNFNSGASIFYGQSFEVVAPTTVGGINLFVVGFDGMTVTLNLHDGADPASDPILASASCLIAENGVAHFYFAEPVDLMTGEYVFSVNPTSDNQFALSGSASNAPGASSYWYGDDGVGSMEENPFGEFSIQFQLVSCAIAPIPTLSQWGMIILLFCFLILGVLYVSRRVHLKTSTGNSNF